MNKTIISKDRKEYLRKIKKMLGDRGILCENDEEVNKYIISMEAKYENRSN